MMWSTLTALTLAAMLAPVDAIPVQPTDDAITERTTYTLLPASKLSVKGTSTVQSYECVAPQITASVSAASAINTVADLQSMETVRLTIPVAAMDCGNRTMDGHMRNALKANASPNIQFQLDSHTVRANGDNAGTVQMRGRLTIAGQTKPVQMTANLSRQADGTVRVRGSHGFDMTEFGVEPPRLMMGTLRVHDPVVVEFDLALRP
jgi:polyisoprenoid-binding protein YceI